MKKISADQVEDGMVLAREVCGPSGNILVNKGTSLSSALGRRLSNWGIPSVYIEGEEDEAADEAAQDLSPEELKTQLMKKFSNCVDNPIMKKIFVTVYQYRLQSKGE
jgi:hypothetical protein